MLLGLHTYSLYLHGIGQAWAGFELPWERQLTTFQVFDLGIELGLELNWVWMDFIWMTGSWKTLNLLFSKKLRPQQKKKIFTWNTICPLTWEISVSASSMI